MTGGHGRISMSCRGTTGVFEQEVGGRKVHLGVAVGSAKGHLGLTVDRAVEMAGSRDVTRSEAQFTGCEKAEAMVNTMRTLNAGPDKAIATLPRDPKRRLLSFSDLEWSARRPLLTNQILTMRYISRLVLNAGTKEFLPKLEERVSSTLRVDEIGLTSKVSSMFF